jgi:hypothetical protein
MRAGYWEEKLSWSSDRLKDPLELTNQTPVARLNQWLGIIVEREDEISGHASSSPTINQYR